MTTTSIFLLILTISHSIYAIKPIPIKNTDVLSDKGDEMCEVCQYVMNYLKTCASDPEFKEMIVDYIEKACKAIPFPLTEVCDYFVDKTVEKYIDELINKSELRICQELDVCESSKEHEYNFRKRA